MTNNTRKERFESALSQKRQYIAVRTSKSLLHHVTAACTCCLKGNLCEAKTHFTATLNLFWTRIVHPTAGANRKD